MKHVWSAIVIWAMLAPWAFADPSELEKVHGGINRETSVHFDVNWPLTGTRRARLKTPRKIIDGTLMVKPRDLADPNGANLSIRIGLERLHGGEEDRQFWNRIGGSEKTYGKDESGDRWLWPNLVWLLNGPLLPRLSPALHTGMGETVDDFGAVVIRHYDSQGVEFPDTAQEPLVSFRWHEWKTNHIKP